MKSLAIIAILSVLALIGGVRMAPRVTVVHGQEPTVTFMFPHDGDILGEPPTVLQICFAEPIDIRDLSKGGDYDFVVIQPAGMHLGLRIVFQLDGYGVAVYPGRPLGNSEGAWKFDWRIRDASTLNPLAGAVTFQVQPGGTPALKANPPDCTATGRPQPTASPQASATNTPPPTASPAASSLQTATPGSSQTATPGLANTRSASDNDDGSDVLEIALIAAGAAGAAAIIGLGAYLVKSTRGSRQRPRQ